MTKEKLEYHRRYNRERYHRMRAWMHEILGGKCVQCQSVEGLEIDHRNPATKRYTVTDMWGYSKENVLKELKKCQLLCKPCHIEKTVIDLGNTRTPGTHGTLSAYRYCHCSKCRSVKSEYMRNWKRNRRAAKLACPPL